MHFGLGIQAAAGREAPQDLAQTQCKALSICVASSARSTSSCKHSWVQRSKKLLHQLRVSSFQSSLNISQSLSGCLRGLRAALWLVVKKDGRADAADTDVLKYAAWKAACSDPARGEARSIRKPDVTMIPMPTLLAKTRTA